MTEQAQKELGDSFIPFWTQPLMQLESYLARAIERKASTVKGVTLIVEVKKLIQVV